MIKPCIYPYMYTSTECTLSKTLVDFLNTFSNCVQNIYTKNMDCVNTGLPTKNETVNSKYDLKLFQYDDSQ